MDHEKEVYYHQLNEPVNANSHKPLYFEEVEK